MTDARIHEIRAAIQTVECCHNCLQPKSRTNTPGDETYIGWPACVNPDCISYMDDVASAAYRPLESDTRVLAGYIEELLSEVIALKEEVNQAAIQAEAWESHYNALRSNHAKT